VLCCTAWQPLAAQQKYSAFDRELLAVYLSIRHFRFMLEGRPFIIFTDHQPLLGSLGRISDPWSARQWRQLSFIAEFAATSQAAPTWWRTLYQGHLKLSMRWLLHCRHQPPRRRWTTGIWRQLNPAAPIARGPSLHLTFQLPQRF
jgi:RNase H-like domain found in reverse transcriptase